MALKRVLQLLVLGALVSVNWQVSAKANADACEINGPEWCCENIVCPIHMDLCGMGGGGGGCYWDTTSQTCEITPCNG